MTNEAQPKRFVDLSIYEGISDRDVALLLGARGHEIAEAAGQIGRERAGHVAQLPPGRERCEAGIGPVLVRCYKPARLGEPWCGTHHPVKRELPQRRSESVGPAWLQPSPPSVEDLLRAVAALPALMVRVEEVLEELTLRVAALEEIKAVLDEAGIGAMQRGSDELLTVAEVARLLKTSRRYVYTQINSGALPSVDLASNTKRVRRSAVAAFLTGTDGRSA